MAEWLEEGLWLWLGVGSELGGDGRWGWGGVRWGGGSGQEGGLSAMLTWLR